MSARRKLVVKGQGPDAWVIFYVEAYRGKVWITAYDCPVNAKAILEPAQADSLVELITQATQQAHSDEQGPAS